MIDNQTIILAITVSSIATYLCRSMGVIFSSKLQIHSWIFDWIKCISIGIIVAVISKIIVFPEGILESTSKKSRLLATSSLVIIYYLFGKNILLSVILATAMFTILNYYNI